MTGSRLQRAIGAKAKRFPQRPGIYIFTNADGRALYVGKAADLRARVRSYLSPGGDGRVRIPFLVEEATDVEFLVTATEQEALLLENTVIKKRKPLYNVKLKDDKSFLMLRLDRSQPWPWFTLVRRRRNDGAEYFGPYASAKSVRRTLRLLHKVVPLRDCTDAVFHNRSRPCIKHQIGRCPAPCVGMIGEPEYDGLLAEAVAILQGNASALLKSLERQMTAAAKELRFEQAQALKVQIQALAQVAERQRVVGRGGDQDVVGLYRVGEELCCVFLLYRQGKLESSRRFNLKSRLPQDLLLADLLGRFYEGDCYVPAQVLVPGEVAETELVQQWLSDKRGRKVQLRTPRRGDARRSLLTAMENARLADAVVADEQARRRSAAERLARRLGLAEAPETIHCLDVSTIQGKHTVASRVAFRDGQPQKALYRRFKISGEAAGDDFSAMAEVVRRSLTLCLTKEGGELPDLLVVDGGRGQVSAAARAIAELGLSEDLALAGLAKSRLQKSSGRKRPASGERLFLLERAVPVPLVADAPETLLVAAIRDEAHRFAITYHRKTRGRLAGELDEIVGVGPARRRSILRHFGSLAAVRTATLEELVAVPGLPPKIAERIHGSMAGGAGAGQPRG